LQPVTRRFVSFSVASKVDYNEDFFRIRSSTYLDTEYF
jgi:hypothetical protein